MIAITTPGNNEGAEPMTEDDKVRATRFRKECMQMAIKVFPHQTYYSRVEDLAQSIAAWIIEEYFDDEGAPDDS